MNTTFELDMDDSTEAKREIIRQSLNEIALEVRNALLDENLGYPVYLGVPSSGNTVVSMMTPGDPSDSDWHRIGTIVQNILSERLDGILLRSTEMPCAMANATMTAAEITAD
jgi:hypothetical protein